MSFKSFLNYVHNYKEGLLAFGYILREAKESYLTMVGEGIDSWPDFLKQPEVGLTVREADSLIKLANFFDKVEVPIEELNLSTARFCANKGIYEGDLIEDMKVLKLSDFKDRHHDHATNEQPQNFTYMVMRRSIETGNMQKVHGLESEEILEAFKDKIDG